MRLYKSGDLKRKMNFELKRRVHAMPRFFVERWQLMEFKRLIALACSHVPFYRKFWNEYGIKPEDIKGLADIQKLPITSKHLFRQYPVGFLMSDLSLPGDYRWATTSGTTGEPFRFPAVKYEKSSRLNVFNECRFLLWGGMKLNHLEKFLKVAKISDSQQQSSGRHLFITCASFRSDVLSVFSRLKDFNPDVVASRPTILFELARLAQNFDSNARPHFKYLVSYGEMLTTEMRNFIEGVLAGEVHDIYGLEEIGCVAVECREHNGLHINEESLFLEVVDPKGYALQQGNIGRIIITSFHPDAAMPFIRYDTGDSGLIMPGLCPCGLRARRIKVFGREGAFVTADSRKFHLSEFENVLNNLSNGIIKYQIAKIGESAFEIRIIPNREFSPADAGYIRASFKDKFGLFADIKIVDFLSYNAAGKTPHFVDEFKSKTS